MGIKKAQAGPVALIVMALVFLLVLTAIGGKLSALWSEAGTNSSLDGVEGFIYDNPLLLIFIGLILGLIGWIYFGS